MIKKDCPGRLLSYILLILTSCHQTSELPCTGDASLKPFRKKQVTSLSAASKSLIQSARDKYPRFEFGTFNNREVFTLITTESATSYYSRHFDTIRTVCRLPITEKEHLFKASNGYWLYNNQSKKGYLIKSIFEPRLTFTDSFDAEQRVDKDKEYIVNPLSIIPLSINGAKTFLYNYGINEKKNINFLDDNILLYPIKGQNHKLGTYSKKYTTSYKALREAWYGLDSSNIVYYTLAYGDSVYKMNLEGAYLKAARIAECRQFEPYGNSDLTDLAYKRKYLATSEQNIALEVVNNRYIAVLRRKKQATIQDTSRYLVTVYDLNLNKLYQDELQANITPAIFHYKNTIFFLAMDFSNIYEYEIE